MSVDNQTPSEPPPAPDREEADTRGDLLTQPEAAGSSLSGCQRQTTPPPVDQQTVTPAPALRHRDNDEARERKLPVCDVIKVRRRSCGRLKSRGALDALPRQPPARGLAGAQMSRAALWEQKPEPAARHNAWERLRLFTYMKRDGVRGCVRLGVKQQQRLVSSSRSRQRETSWLWMDESAALLGPSITWFLLAAFSRTVRVERCWLHTLNNPSHGGMCVHEPGQGHTEGPSFENSPKRVKPSARCEETTPESHVSERENVKHGPDVFGDTLFPLDDDDEAGTTGSIPVFV
ncbi:unnamed protein product [Pleuronectes platessa]|uniref:Uncharacterized protein n=1 Tax=Pleuronectes platessa TaxID=8262 RepID=A0A9N7Z879_PLEPL|nr:unnamed protein product [Pleuronectes platessa]